MLLLLLTVVCYGKTLDRQLQQLTSEQKKVLNYTIEQGKKHNLGYLLAAIAWKESNLGLWPMNLDDGKYGSYSIYHIQLDYYLKREGIKNTSWNRSRHAEVLLLDIDRATEAVISIIELWKRTHKTASVTDKVIKSYNAGYNVKSTAAINYHNDIQKRIDAITRYHQQLAVK